MVHLGCFHPVFSNGSLGNQILIGSCIYTFSLKIYMYMMMLFYAT